MEPPNEGQIIMLERDEGAHRERIYIHPPDGLNVVVVEERLKIWYFSLFHWIVKLFLPKGFPNSVSKDYVPYQKYFNMQTFFGTIAGILSTQNMLCCVGITDGTILAAAVSWIYKDILAQAGKLLFMTSKGILRDSYSKRWQLYSGLIYCIAMCLDMAHSLFGRWGIVVVFFSTLLKTIESVSKTTRIALTGHHSIKGNLADVAAKSSSQEIIIKLVSSIITVLLMKYVGYNVAIFIVAMCLHTVFNYMSVRVVCLNTFNEPRFIIAVQSYLSGEFVPKTAEVNRIEPLLYNQQHSTDRWLTTFKVKIGYSVKELLRTNPRAFDLRLVERVYENHTYILFPDMRHRIMYVLMKPRTFPNTTICAYLHALILSILICAINKERLPLLQVGSHNFTTLCDTLMTSNWPRVPIRYSTNNGLRYGPSERLHCFTQLIIDQEWSQFYSGLLRSGWVLHRHLFVTGDWTVGYGMDNEPTHDINDYSESINPAAHFETFKESLQLAIAYRDAELPPVDAENVQEPVQKNTQEVHVEPNVEPEPQPTAEEIRRRWIADNEIEHIGDCVIGPQTPPARRRRPKKY
ncbi:RUS family member 1 [Epargyreus clarus]|uniref:RUS family member 1 n=1 Tax=Epargyreus clarus TaxID=520877 RepID=UPI003C2FD2A9